MCSTKLLKTLQFLFDKKDKNCEQVPGCWNITRHLILTNAIPDPPKKTKPIERNVYFSAKRMWATKSITVI